MYKSDLFPENPDENCDITQTNLSTMIQFTNLNSSKQEQKVVRQNVLDVENFDLTQFSRFYYPV